METVVKTLIVSVVSITALIVTSVTLIMIFSPETDVTPILAILAPTITSLGTLAGIYMVKGDTGKMLNGVMDRKIQTNVRAVLDGDDVTIIPNDPPAESPTPTGYTDPIMPSNA